MLRTQTWTDPGNFKNKGCKIPFSTYAVLPIPNCNFICHCDPLRELDKVSLQSLFFFVSLTFITFIIFYLTGYSFSRLIKNPQTKPLSIKKKSPAGVNNKLLEKPRA